MIFDSFAQSANVPSAFLQPKRIGIVGFNGITSIDLIGPQDVFATARCEDGRGQLVPCYDVVTLGVKNKSFVSETAIKLTADCKINDALEFDTIIVPGGSGLREAETIREVSRWLKKQATHTRRIASVCTGLYALAQSGLIGGRQVTTHWRFLDDCAQRFPDLYLNRAAVFLKDGPFYTSGAGTAGIEMAIALVCEDYGADCALSLAREFAVQLRPPGDDEHNIDSSLFQSGPMERLADLPSWILTHLRDNLSVPALARRSGVSTRHFTRLCQRVLHKTPAELVEELRVSEARRRLLTPRDSIETIAFAVGFASPGVFRCVFEKRMGLTPSAFRRRFQRHRLIEERQPSTVENEN